MSFYTYIYLRQDGSPYYVGKGISKRAWESHGGHIYVPKDPSRVILQPWPDETTAFAFERYQIDFWGRKDLGTGCLRNLTDGGEGTSGFRHSVETKQRMSTTRQGHEVSEATRQSISRAKKDRLLSPEHRKALATAKLGTSHTVSHNQAIKDNWGRKDTQAEWNKKRWNSYLSPEYRSWLVRKMAAARWGNTFTETEPTVGIKCYQ